MTERPTDLKLRGIIPPMVTPLQSQDALDAPGLERLIEHLIGGGVHGLFVLGTTGEAPSLSYRLRRELIERTCRQVAGRVPVLVGVTDTAFVETVALAEYSRRCGASAVVAAPPYYFSIGQPELLEYLTHLVAALPLPLVLYNMPSLTKTSYEIETVRRAAELPNVIGLKDSSGDMAYFHRLQSALAGHQNFALFTGPEELLAEAVMLGADGAICSGANVFPKLYVALYEAVRAGQVARVRELHSSVLAVGARLYAIGRFGSSKLKGIKCALACKGICEDFLNEPFHRFREEERRRVAQAVAELELLLADVT
jgi:4-hydroxy-tetrahydrodipicolinate synthase